MASYEVIAGLIRDIEDLRRRLDQLDRIEHSAGGSSAPPDATYITQTPSAGLSAEQALSTLSNGILKHSGGVMATAVAGTDYATAHSHLTGVSADQHHNQSHGMGDHTGTGSPAELSDSAASAGVGTLPARADHTHKKAINVRKNSAGSVFTRPRINLIEGTNITLTVADDAGSDEVDVTIAAAGGGAALDPMVWM